MKYLKKLTFIITIGAILLTSCNKDNLKNLNINPQTSLAIDLNFLFSSAQLGAASGGASGDNRYIDWRTNIGMASTAIQQMATTGGISNNGDKYTHNFETSDAPWEFIYGTTMQDIGEILRQTGPGGFAEGKNQNMKQAARILRVFLFQRLTDYYNRVPYFETEQATSKLFFPKYDSQKDIYADLVKELNEAIAGFGADDPTDGFAAADLYYNGNIGQWKKWAYSLMLRIGMRVSFVDLPMANTLVTAAVAGGVFTSNADNVLVPMDIGPGVWVNQNGISRAYIPGDGGEPAFLSKRLIDFLKGPDTASTADDDPRLMIFTAGIGVWQDEFTFVPIITNPLKQKGMPNGSDQTKLETLEGKSLLTSIRHIQKLIRS